jgi:flagellar export protein FliJ
MNKPQSLQTLGRVVSLRAREQERISLELARQQAQLERYRRNVQRLENLCEQSGASGAMPIALSANCADYKQAVMDLAHAQREEAGRHETELATTRQALHAAMRRHGAVDQALQRRLQGWTSEQAVRAQKTQDELATQVWWRGRT